MKCSRCFLKQCGRSYAQRHLCVGEKEGIKCSCVCQITLKEARRASAKTIGVGIAATTAGIGLTVATGGVLTLIAGASIIGAGSSLILSPIKKKIIGEQITQKDVRQDIFFGATVGALTTPFGVATSLVTKSISDAIRLRIRNRKRVIDIDESIEGIKYRPFSEFEVERGEETEGRERGI